MPAEFSNGSNPMGNQRYVMPCCHAENGKRWIDMPAAIYSEKKPDRSIKFTSAIELENQILCPVHCLSELDLQIVTKGPSSALWNEYIERYHYLGYKPLPGTQLRCFITAGEQIVGGTKGHGKLGHNPRKGTVIVPIKDVWVYPLEKNFKTLLKATHK